MAERYKMGFIAQLSYGPKRAEQREMLLDAGVSEIHIFEAPEYTPADAAKACRPDKPGRLVVAFEQVLGRAYGEVFAILDKRGADLYSIATDTVYPCTNGQTFGAFKAIMDRNQTRAARESQKYGRKPAPPVKLSDKQLSQGEQMLARDMTMREVTDHFGVAPNYFTRKGITKESAKAKYDKK